jgi:hypothetical protein
VLVRFLAVVAVAWLALMPPLFTGGACTREFEEESARIGKDAKSIASPTLASGYWTERNIPYSVVSREQCRRAKPRFLQNCGEGPLVYARVPVTNTICSLYRDSEILVQLQYNDRNRLARTQVDMSPYKSLPIPFTGVTLHWAR